MLDGLRWMALSVGVLPSFGDIGCVNGTCKNDLRRCKSSLISVLNS